MRISRAWRVAGRTRTFRSRDISVGMVRGAVNLLHRRPSARCAGDHDGPFHPGMGASIQIRAKVPSPSPGGRNSFSDCPYRTTGYRNLDANSQAPWGTRKEKRIPELGNYARSLKGEQPCALVRRTHRDERHD